MDIVFYIKRKEESLKDPSTSKTVKMTDELRLREALEMLAKSGTLEEVLSVLR